MKNSVKLILITIVLATAAFFILRSGLLSGNRANKEETWHSPDVEFVGRIEKHVVVTASPAMKFSYDSMKAGVLQHLDRNYTYDIVPDELQNGILFQGIHRPVKGTSLQIKLLEPAIIYFFFHASVDGGYSEIFENLTEWKRCDVAPKYDINNGDHGLRMVMYKLDMGKGTYQLPATTKDKACFNILFKFR